MDSITGMLGWVVHAAMDGRGNGGNNYFNGLFKKNIMMAANENSSLFYNELKNWLQEKGFSNDRGWKEKHDGMGFYSFVKENFRIEIRTDWNLKFDWYGQIFVQILNCEKEKYSSEGYIGWLGQKVLNTFGKPFTRSFFDGLCEYYEL